MLVRETGIAFLRSDPIERVTFRLENVEISAREGCENELFMQAENFKEINFRNVKLHGFRNPTIRTKGDGRIVMVETEGITVLPAEE